ncbi:MAG: HAD-IIA family hydrolase [Actinobacteria bacterium]|nr:HAD-IIA family hydrolase [Actinomycetota bacterium]
MPSLIDRYRAFALDLDGVVWRGTELLPGAFEAISAIRDRGKPLLLLTNNGSYSPEGILERIAPDGGLDGIEVLTSTIVAIRWVRENRLEGARGLVLATEAVVSQVSDVLDLQEPSAGGQAEIVLVGRDLAFDFDRLTRASDAIRGGAYFLALNRDATMPVEGGLEPGTGAIVAAIEAASGKPAIVLGKPEAPMMDAAVDILGSEGVLLVGDRLDSDIAGAKTVGWDSALVLSGVTGRNSQMKPAPDFVLENLHEIL